MSESLIELFSKRIDRQKYISIINSSHDRYVEAIELALSDEKPQAWRCAWILNHCSKKQDARLQPYLSNFINIVEKKEEGHQREILKLIQKMDVDEDNEGKLFDICMTIWETIGKTPSVRITAFKTLVSIAKKHPELASELKFLTHDDYTDTLSSGIKNSFHKLVRELG